MAVKQDHIAVFDSGVGGISVLRELIALMPQEKYIYFGDSANAPYGTRTTEEIRQLTFAAVQKLMKQPIKALVVACNTATAAAINQLRESYKDLIIVGIEPALKPAVTAFPNGHIGVMATPVTLREEKMAQLLKKYPHPNCTLIPAPGLMELVEAGLADTPQMDAFLTPLLEPFKGTLDGLVLGCTHYPFAAASIKRVLGESTRLFDGGAGTARQTKRLLEQAGLLHEGPGELQLLNSLNNPQILEITKELLYKEVQYG
jgi:glutamate racemase